MSRNELLTTKEKHNQTLMIARAADIKAKIQALKEEIACRNRELAELIKQGQLNLEPCNHTKIDGTSAIRKGFLMDECSVCGWTNF